MIKTNVAVRYIDIDGDKNVLSGCEYLFSDGKGRYYFCNDKADIFLQSPLNGKVFKYCTPHQRDLNNYGLIFITKEEYLVAKIMKE
jgi:hypothetical protein